MIASPLRDWSVIKSEEWLSRMHITNLMLLYARENFY
jgi:hypothetical protein